MDFGRKRHIGEQPAGQVLPVDAKRPTATGTGNAQVGQAGGSDCANFAAGGAGGGTMRRGKRVVGGREEEPREDNGREKQDKNERGMAPGEGGDGGVRKVGNVTRGRGRGGGG